MKKCRDLIPLRQPDRAIPPRWGLYSLKDSCWLHGDFKTRRQADHAALLIEAPACSGAAGI